MILNKNIINATQIVLLLLLLSVKSEPLSLPLLADLHVDFILVITCSVAIFFHTSTVHCVSKKTCNVLTQKLRHANSILEYFEYFCQMSSKSILIILSYTVSKLELFSETQCLPPEVTSSRTLSSFKSEVKTYLFSLFVY